MRRVWRRLPLVLAVIAAGQVCFGQDLSKKISYSAVARPVKKALDELSKLSGVRLEASLETADEIVVLGVKDTSLDDLMRRLADCLNAEWQKTDAGYLLRRPTALAQKERQEEVAQTAEAFARTMQDQAEELAKQGAFTEATAHSIAVQLEDIYHSYPDGVLDQTAWPRITAVLSKSPSSRLVARIAVTMDPATLAALPQESRTVFCSNPTRMQRPLPAKTMGLLGQFLKEQKIWADEVKKAAGSATPNRNWSFGGLETNMSAPKTVLVSVVRYGRVAQIEARIFDDKGLPVASNHFYLNQTAQPVEGHGSAGTTSAEAKFVFSRGASAMSRALIPFMGGPRPGFDPGPMNIDDETRQAVLHPETTDPLAFAPSEALLQTAEARHDNVIACVPDSIFSTFLWVEGPNITPSSFLSWLTRAEIKVEEDHGWLMVRPFEASRVRRTRIDRRALGVLLRSLAKNGTLTLEDEAAFALSTRGLHRDSLSGPMAQLVSFPDSLPQDGSQLDMYKLYGLLTPDQMVGLKSKDGMSLRRLSAAQREIVEYLTYDNEYSVQYQPPQTGASPDWSAHEIYMNGLYREPTESLPNGIPVDGFVKADFTTDDVVFLGKQQEVTWRTGQAMSASELANQVFEQEHVEIFPWMKQPGQKISLDSFRAGTRRRISFTFQLTDTLSLSQALQQSDPRGGNVTMDRLPAAFKTEYEKDLATMAANYKNVKPGGIGTAGGRSIPPGR